MIIGIDEVGYGAWAGPLYAVAFCFISCGNDDSCDITDKILDSKIISAKKRELISKRLKDNFFYGIASIDNHEIDRINIRNADFKAMELAYVNLLSNLKNAGKNVEVEKIYIDGNGNPGFSNKIETVIDGDAIIKEVSAASIIAKVARDSFMVSLHDEFPYYGWDSLMGSMEGKGPSTSQNTQP